MKKLFISQPMKDKTNEQIESERRRAYYWVESHCGDINDDIEVIESFFKNAPTNANPLWYLGKSIQLLGEADIVYFCKDWEQYNGCTIEHECAVRYGKKCIYAQC